MMPRRNDTPMTHIIFNCVVILVLSSALPVLSRILGKLSYILGTSHNDTLDTVYQ